MKILIELHFEKKLVKRNFKEIQPIENMLLKAKEKNIYKKFLSKFRTFLGHCES